MPNEVNFEIDVETEPSTDFDMSIELNAPYPDSSDATATASDIRSGRTAYVSNQKIRGTAVPQIASNVLREIGFPVNPRTYNSNDVIYTRNRPTSEIWTSTSPTVVATGVSVSISSDADKIIVKSSTRQTIQSTVSGRLRYTAAYMATF